MINKKSVASNILWRWFERFGAQIVTFIVSLILARILDPETYGVVALLTIFITILQVFVDSGLANALIQKKDADQLDFSTVFYTNVAFCIGLYCLLFFASPFIASFYENSGLVPLIRVLGITILFSGVKNVEQAYVSKHMLFKKFFWATLFGTLLSAIIGIYLALNGFGPWALIGQMITNVAVDTIILWIIVKWRPTFEFSFERLKTLYNYGWKLLAASLIATIYEELRQLIIGKHYSSTQLAFYNKGKQIPKLVVTNINSSIDSVLLSAMSSVQDNKEHVRAMTRRSLKVSVFILAPLLIGLTAISNSLIMLLLGEKWVGMVFFMRIFCITMLFYPIHTINLNAIKAMGRSDLFLGLEIIKKVFGLFLILITMWISVEAMALSLLVASFFSQIINSWPNKKLINYGYISQIKDIFPGLFLAIFMGIGVYLIQFLPFSHYLLTLVVQVIAGFVFYVVASRLLKIESYFYVRDMILSFIRIKFLHKKQ